MLFLKLNGLENFCLKDNGFEFIGSAQMRAALSQKPPVARPQSSASLTLEFQRAVSKAYEHIIATNHIQTHTSRGVSMADLQVAHELIKSNAKLQVAQDWLQKGRAQDLSRVNLGAFDYTFVS